MFQPSKVFVQDLYAEPDQAEKSADLFPRPVSTSLLSQLRTSRAENKVQMLEPSERAVLSYLLLRKVLTLTCCPVGNQACLVLTGFLDFSHYEMI